MQSERDESTVDRSTVLAVTEDAQHKLRDHNVYDRLDTEHQVIHDILD